MLTRFQILNILIIQMITMLTLKTVYAQKSKIDLANDLSIMMEQHRENKPITVSSKDILENDPLLLLENFAPYEKDTSPRVRESALAFAWQIARLHPRSEVRKEVTSRLLKGLNDPDDLVWQHAGKYLLDFHTDDFTDVNKSYIKKIFMESDSKRMNYVIRVIGIANLKEEMKKLGELLIDESMYEKGDHVGKWYGTVGWAARLARARMGSKADLLRAIELVEMEQNTVIRVTRVLTDLSYIRQPEVVEVLQRYLNSTERLPRIKEFIPGSCYCQYAIELLAQIIEGFPIESIGSGGYSQDEIELARKWMKNKNNWINSIRR